MRREVSKKKKVGTKCKKPPNKFMNFKLFELVLQNLLRIFALSVIKLSGVTDVHGSMVIVLKSVVALESLAVIS